MRTCTRSGLSGRLRRDSAAGARASSAGESSGFTLIEVILALALTAMILGLLSTAMYVVAQDWNRSSDHLERNLDDALAVLQLERALVGAFPHGYLDREQLARYVYFVGEDDYLSWVSTVSPQRDAGLMAWELFSDEEGVHLSLAPAYSDFPGERLQQAEPQLLLSGYTASFAYLYAAEPDQKLWLDQWLGDEYQSLPLAVYVRLEPDEEITGSDEVLEIVARINNYQNRNLRPNALQGIF